jgi:4-hydroxybenzoate polyprenyltransferase
MNSYLRLMRVNKPAGSLLLWYPTAWALWLANQGRPSFYLILIFLIGTFLMRSAGCVVNDIADRHVDGHVKRTRTRPLVSGELNLIQALALLLLLLFCAWLLLIRLPHQCFYYALAAVFITVLYPFCKRFIQGPQFVLGLAFSMGIPMAFAASNQRPSLLMFFLLLINFCWILAYDTEYAMVDKDDDLLIGVKSTAILFAHYDRLIIGGLQLFFHLLWLFVALNLYCSESFIVCWFAAAFVLVYQQILLAKQEREAYFQAFKSNSWYGLLMWIGIIISSIQLF